MHFFIDPQYLPTQLPADRYGAIDPDSYRVSSKFTLSATAKAYAMLAGNMIVQPCATDSSLLNIIILPIFVNRTQTRTHDIRYIVYRGIRKDSLFNGATLKIKSELPTNHFLYRMWERLEKWKLQYPDTDAEAVLPYEMGYDETISGQVMIEHIFAEAVEGIYPTFVQEGMILGEFAAGNISVEVILAHDPVPPAVTDSRIDITYLRKAEHLIDATGLTGLARSAKQEILHRYVDIAALLGTLYTAGVKATDEQTGTVQKYRGQAIYDILIRKFDTGTTIYLDIRNDSGYAYNFYGKYGDTSGKDLQYTDAQQNTNTVVYGTQGWPILTLDSRVADYSTFALRLRTDHNTRPVLYIQYVDVGDIYYKRFTDSTELLNEDSTPGWTKDVVMHFPQVTDDSATYSLAQYLTLNYFEAPELPVQGPQNRGINSLNEIDAYYNNAFCATQLVNMDETVFTHAVQTEATYVNGQLPDMDTAFAFAGDAGVNWDDSKVVFYAKSVFTKERSLDSNDLYIRSGFEGFTLMGDNNSQSFLTKEIVLLKTEISKEIGNMDILSILHNSSPNGGYEDVLCIGITRSEFERLTDAPGLSEFHFTYPYLEQLDIVLKDAYATSYLEFRLGLIGIDSNREWTTAFPLLNIILYSTDGLLVSSEEFSQSTLVKSKTIKLPTWQTMFENYPGNNIDTYTLYKTIGGKILGQFKSKDEIDISAFANSCAIRMSRGLVLSGIDLPESSQSYDYANTGNGVTKGDDKKNYWFRVRSLSRYMKDYFGKPDFEKKIPMMQYPSNKLKIGLTTEELHSYRNRKVRLSSEDWGNIYSMKGIVVFEVNGWSDASGHFTLWNGSNLVYPGSPEYDNPLSNKYYFDLFDQGFGYNQNQEKIYHFIQTTKIMIWKLKEENTES